MENISQDNSVLNEKSYGLQRGGGSYGQFWFGKSIGFPGFLYKKNNGVGARRSTKFAPGGNRNCNTYQDVNNSYVPGSGVGGTSISVRRAKQRYATICNNSNAVPAVPAVLSLPTGSIIAFAGTSSIPTGYLLCDGAGVSRTTYANLFAVIGYLYGGAWGTFRLPNLIHKFIRGSAINTGTIVGGSLTITNDNILKASLTSTADAGNSVLFDGKVSDFISTQGEASGDSGPQIFTTTSIIDGGVKDLIGSFTTSIGTASPIPINYSPRCYEMIYLIKS